MILTMNYLEVAKKGALKHDPIVHTPVTINNISKKKKEKSPIKGKYPRKRKCHKCDEAIIIDPDIPFSLGIENHLNNNHITDDNFYYIVCPKCLFYLYTPKDVSYEDAIKSHNQEKHFVKQSDKNIIKISNTEFEDVSEQYGVNQLLKDTALDTY